MESVEGNEGEIETESVQESARKEQSSITSFLIDPTKKMGSSK